MYAIPVFARLGKSGGRYRMPSGRIAVISDAGQLDTKSAVVTLHYLDTHEEVEFSKAWFNQHAVPA